jgi:DNA-binding transcriptional MocR family regulator
MPDQSIAVPVDQRAGLAGALDGWWEHDGRLPARIAAALARAVESGRLGPLTRLPSERALARSLGVSRGTIIAAYDDLKARGMVERRPGSGTRVSAQATGSSVARLARNPVFHSILEGDDAVAGAIIDLTVSHPGPVPVAVTDALQHALHDLPRRGDGLGYLPAGLPALRRAIATRLTVDGLPTDSQQVLVTNGAQQAIALLARLLVSVGEPVLVESPTYIGALDALAHAGGQLLALDLLEAPSPGALIARAAARSNARLLYLTLPNTPTGALPAEAWRADLLDGAAAAGVTVIEDATLAHLVLADPPPRPLAALSPGPERILIGSASKLWWGGLRVGWIRASAPLTEQLTRIRAVADLGGATLEQAAVAHLLPNIDQARAERQALLRHALATFTAAIASRLPDWTAPRPDAGPSLWVQLACDRAEAFADTAARHGVRVVPGPRFSPTGQHPDRLRLQFLQPAAAIQEATRRLALATRADDTKPPN